jgi:hypothetical protein
MTHPINGQVISTCRRGFPPPANRMRVERPEALRSESCQHSSAHIKAREKLTIGLWIAAKTFNISGTAPA